MTVFEDLSRRGLIAQASHPEKIKEILEGPPCTFYIGFDATADSLHVGHLLQLIVMRRMQKAGHIPIALLGTGTTMIGDPTDRTDMRQMLSPKTIEENAERFKIQMSRFLDFSEGKAKMIKNGDWLLNLNYIDFLRKVGRHFSVNKMLAAECVKSRLERGLSFLEFNYMLMQSYDFLKLYEDHNCIMELGGNDQWSNMLGGIELVRRVKDKEVYCMTFTLLTTKDGKKMGKTQNGALWLDADKVPPYEFYQYFRNVDDADVIRCLKLLTFIPIEEIEAMENWEGSKLNEAKEILAYQLTSMVHGEEAAEKAQQTSKELFSSAANAENMPQTQLTDNQFTDGQIGVLSALSAAGLCKSNGEARRLVQQGGISINGNKVSDPALSLTKDELKNGIIIKKGKKIFHRIFV